jgi:hypothetical protein
MLRFGGGFPKMPVIEHAGLFGFRLMSLEARKKGPQALPKSVHILEFRGSQALAIASGKPATHVLVRCSAAIQPVNLCLGSTPLASDVSEERAECPDSP